MQKYRGLFHSVCKCIRLPPQSSPSAKYEYYTCTGRFLFFPPLTAQTRSKNALCWQLAAINSTVILYVGGFPQMRVFLSNGKTKLHRSGLSPDRHRKIQTRLISASFTWSWDEGAQWNSAQIGERKKRKKKKGKRIEKKQKRSIRTDHHSSLSLG